jgi:hypothetical protein
MWKKYKPPRHDTVLLSMGMSLDTQPESPAGRVPAESKYLSVARNSPSSLKRLLALVQMFTTVPIYQTAGMVIVEERHPPLTQS